MLPDWNETRTAFVEADGYSGSLEMMPNVSNAGYLAVVQAPTWLYVQRFDSHDEAFKWCNKTVFSDRRNPKAPEPNGTTVDFEDRKYTITGFRTAVPGYDPAVYENDWETEDRRLASIDHAFNGSLQHDCARAEPISRMKSWHQSIEDEKFEKIISSKL